MSGEHLHAQGAKGARRAKLWLESTTRADAYWINPHKVALPKLTFSWADNRSFSFDLAGILRGAEVDGQEFFAESKDYKDQGDQPALYEEYLAKCYRAYKLRPERCDHFMWITWAPFSATVWSQLRDTERVRKAVARYSERVFGTPVSWESVPEDTSAEVASRVWIIVLSERQEKFLRLTPEHMSLIEAHVTNQQAMGT